MPKETYTSTPFIALVVLFAGVFLYEKLLTEVTESNTSKKPVSVQETRELDYLHIRPALYFEYENLSLDNSEIDMKKELASFIESEKEGNKTTNVSVYYEALNSGHSFSINEEIEYIAASLIKVPVMIASYKLSESDNSFLEEKIAYDGRYNASANVFGGEASLVREKSYTIDRLVEKMIVSSDNLSRLVLSNYLPQRYSQEELKKVSMDLDSIIKTSNYSGVLFTSPQKYAAVFRILYNSSYLNRELSEKALALLSSVAYIDGINVGVPKDIRVAHKFGFSDSTRNLNSVNFHDCGIVYNLENPYILCVMTEGKNAKQQEAIIQKISKIVYNYVIIK